METILEAIGHTPLIQLKRSIPAGHASIFAKLERFNPGGSLKDRIVIKIVTEAEKKGQLKPGGTIYAGTTGNSGIGLAYIGAVKKYKVVLTMPENYSLERRRILECYGAEVHLTPAAEGLKGAIQRAKEMARDNGGFLFAQFEDPLTVQAHASTTAVEIDAALVRTVHAVVGCIGTGGSLMGVGGYFKKKGALVIAVEPTASPLLSKGKAAPHKIQGTSPGFLPPIMDRDLIDEIITVSDQEAFEGAREVAQNEGILAGISCGANFVAARRIAGKLGPGKNVVTIFPDGGERYFSLEKYFKGE